MPSAPTDDPKLPEVISPVGEGFTWVARITAVGLGMALPAVAGSWLDRRFDTGFFALAGLVVGLATALAWIVRLSNAAPGGRRGRGRRETR